MTASGNPDYAVVASWIAAAWSGKTYEELDDPGGSLFVMLDMKLANCMVAMMNKAGERGKRFRDRVNLRMEEAARKGNNVIKGRQIVWMLLDSFKTFDNSELAFGFDHLSKLKVQNGDLHEFLIQWNHVLDNMGGVELTHGALRDVLYRKIKEEDELKYDINLYERMHEGDPKKTYKHLMSCVESVIKLQDQRKNILEKEALLSAKKPREALSAPAAAAPSEDHRKADGRPHQEGGRGRGHQKGEQGRRFDGNVANQSPDSAEPKGKGKDADRSKGAWGKSKKDGKGKSLEELKKQPCYFHNFATCKFGKDCHFSHEVIGDAQKQALKRSPSASAGGRAPSAGQRGASVGADKKDAKKGGEKNYCFTFLQSGACSRDQCPFLHLNQKEVDAKKSDSKKGSGTPAVVSVVYEEDECEEEEAICVVETGGAVWAPTGLSGQCGLPLAEEAHGLISLAEGGVGEVVISLGRGGSLRARVGHDVVDESHLPSHGGEVHHCMEANVNHLESIVNAEIARQRANMMCMSLYASVVPICQTAVNDVEIQIAMIDVDDLLFLCDSNLREYQESHRDMPTGTGCCAATTIVDRRQRRWEGAEHA